MEFVTPSLPDPVVRTKRVIICGAAGRDFHNFLQYWRKQADVQVVAFTAQQIPFIDNRNFPPEMCGEAYPNGIPIYLDEQLEELVKKYKATHVELAFSDVHHERVMHHCCRVQALGAQFVILGRHDTQLKSTKPVIALCATRTGVGKSQAARYVWSLIRAAGLRTVVVRHPMPYGTLLSQRCQRFVTVEDLKKHKCTVEEIEEYEPHITRGAIVYAGVDYEMILQNAEREADIILWDGGNNDFPFFRPDLLITLIDPLRPTDGERYFPGETNVRTAHLLLMNKVDSATSAQIDECVKSCRALNPTAPLVKAGSQPWFKSKADEEAVRGKRVLCVEDGPTTTHGNMKIGAAWVAAKRLGATPVSCRPYAVGSLKVVCDKYELDEVVPAMGYSDEQLRELEATINATPCDLVVIGSPIDLLSLITIKHKNVRAYYDLVLDEEAKRTLDATVQAVFPAPAAPVVVALGGNALMRKGDTGTWEMQGARARAVAKVLAAQVPAGGLVITHGNGPQVGAQLLRSAIARDAVPPAPVSVCDAATEGEIGWVVAHAMSEALRDAKSKKRAAALVTEVVVDSNDKEFKEPSKYVGSHVTEAEAKDLERKYGWRYKADADKGWRRVVPSPAPLEIMDTEAVARLIADGGVAIAAGGGGVPVARNATGELVAVDAVVDKDLTAALLASKLRARRFVILTDVEQVCVDYGKPSRRQLGEVAAAELATYQAAGHFPPGSMGPKVQAALNFLSSAPPGSEVVITTPESYGTGGARTIVRACAHVLLPESLVQRNCDPCYLMLAERRLAAS